MQDFVSDDTIDAFKISPLLTAMRMLHNSEREACNGWKETIHHLLDLGPNLRARLNGYGGTILDQIMDIAQSPFESKEVCEKWLLVLESFGLDIEEHLQTKRSYQYEGSVPILLPHMGNFSLRMVTVIDTRSFRNTAQGHPGIGQLILKDTLPKYSMSS